jgi:hypothetical protein
VTDVKITEPGSVMNVNPVQIPRIIEETRIGFMSKNLSKEICTVCGEKIAGEEATSHRYFGVKHVRCLDRAMKQAKLDIIELDKEIKELEK